MTAIKAVKVACVCDPSGRNKGCELLHGVVSVGAGVVVDVGTGAAGVPVSMREPGN